MSRAHGASDKAAASHDAGAELVVTMPQCYGLLAATCLSLQAAAYAEMTRQQSNFLNALQTCFTVQPWPSLQQVQALQFSDMTQAWFDLFAKGNAAIGEIWGASLASLPIAASAAPPGARLTARTPETRPAFERRFKAKVIPFPDRRKPRA